MDSRVDSLSLRAARVGVVVGLLALASCGGLEWPPPKAWTGSVRAPTLTAPSLAPQVGNVVVARGDSVWGLSQRHGVSMRAIIEANGLRPPFHLTAGQRLTIPARTAATAVAATTQPPPVIVPSPKAPAGRVEMVELPPPAAGGPPAPEISAGAPRASAPLAPAPAESMPGKAPATALVPPPPATGKGFVWPVKGQVVSSYGDKAKGMRNDGVNIAAPRGAPVVAAETGVVTYAGNELKGFGNLVLVKHADGWVSAYAHADEILVKRGDEVRKGEPIARVGSSGNVGEPQLHFELRRGKQTVDPESQLPPTGA